MSDEPMDLKLLYAAGFREWTPFSIRYSHQKISDWARKSEHWPAQPGRLWEMLVQPASIVHQFDGERLETVPSVDHAYDEAKPSERRTQ